MKRLRRALTLDERKRLLEQVERIEDEGYYTPEETEELYEAYDEYDADDRTVIEEW